MRGKFKALLNGWLLTLVSGLFFSIPVWSELTSLFFDTPGSFGFCRTENELPESAPADVQPIYQALDLHQTDCFVLSGNDALNKQALHRLQRTIIPKVSQAMMFELTLHLSNSPDIYPILQSQFEEEHVNDYDTVSVGIRFFEKSDIELLTNHSVQAVCGGCGGDDDDDEDDPWGYFEIYFIPHHYQELDEDTLFRLMAASTLWLIQMRGSTQGHSINLASPTFNVGRETPVRQFRPKTTRNKYRRHSSNVLKLLSKPSLSNRQLRLRYHKAHDNIKALLKRLALK